MDTFGPKIGDYIVEEELGRGASSILFRARHDVLDEVVALKVLRDSRYIESLRREAKILHKLDHPSIIKLRAVSLQSDPAYLVLDLVEGKTLQDHLRQGQTLEIDEVLRMALALLSALATLHDLDLVHGDIKPANILLGQDRSVTLVDFGFSHDMTGADRLELSADLADFQPKKRYGTFAYAAPELIKGDDIDARTDLYSLAVVIFEMLTGQRPEPGDKPSDLRSDTPTFLDEIFVQCYCRKDKRPASANELSTLIRPYYMGSIQSQARQKDGRPEQAISVKLLQRAKKVIESGAFDEAEKVLEELELTGQDDPRVRALREEFEEIRREVSNGRNKEDLRRSLGEYDELLSLFLKRIDLTPRNKELYAELGQLKKRLQTRNEQLEEVRWKQELGLSMEARDLLGALLEILPGDRQCRLALSALESYEKRVSLVLDSAKQDQLSDPRWRLGQVEKLLKDLPRHEGLLGLKAELRDKLQAEDGGRRAASLLGAALALALGIFLLGGVVHAQSVHDRSYALLQERDWEGSKENFENAAFFVPWFLTDEAKQKLHEAWERKEEDTDPQKGRYAPDFLDSKPHLERLRAEESKEKSGQERERDAR